MRDFRTMTRLPLCVSLLLAFTVSQAELDKLDLDRTIAFGSADVAELVAGPAFDASVHLGTNLVSCQLTPYDGLYCIDFKAVRVWVEDPDAADPWPVVVSCADDVLGLDAKKDNTCTSVAVDADGAIWVGGKDKGKSNSLIKLVPNEGSCPADSLGAPASNPNLCAYQVAAGRPLLMDLVAVEDYGILALEGGKTLVAFLEDGSTVELANGKGDFGLAGPEQVSDITYLDNYVLLATTAGRVLAWYLAGSGPAVPVANWSDSGTTCGGEPGFSVEASASSGLVYMGSGEACEVVILQPAIDGDSLSLTPVGAPIATGLATTAGVTAAPGNVLDLTNCGNETCSLEDVGRAELSHVQLASDASGLTYFHVKGIPDCRWLNPAPEVCTASTIVTLDDGTLGAVAQQLNVTPMLPEEIQELFAGNPLPELLVPHYVRGQAQNNFLINGFFGVTEDGVIFRDTFELYYKWVDTDQKYFECDAPNLLNWDVAGTVSERFPGWDGTHAMFVTNVECGGTRTRDPGFSFKPYNLEPTPCTFNPNPNDTVWTGDGDCTGDPDDAVYAKMLLIMVDDYANTVKELACKDADGSGAPPLDNTYCPLVEGKVANMIDKLHKCWYAAQEPKQSARDQNCQAFYSQLSNLQELLDVIEPQAPADGIADVANRVGELKARAMTLRHVFLTRFMEALTDEGFVEPQP